MNDKSSLLDQLKIDRPPEVERAPRWPWCAASGLAVLALAGTAGWLLSMRGVPIAVATAQFAPADVAIGPGSILDASGYVVARRQATVSSKITGKVIEVAIEEGQRVERGQVIARLDVRTRVLR